MRHIDFDLIKIGDCLPDNWLDSWLAEAKDAAEKISLGEDIDISKPPYSKIWQDFKPVLELIVGEKCWYCETIQSRSDKDVDHFRPKNRLSKVKPIHSGYRWLVFDYKNFRYSCQCCNRVRTDKVKNTTGGKGSYFPLIDESKRAWKPGDEIYEKPKLLDPCIKQDVKLLDFNEDGTPCHIPSADVTDQDRVKVSIRHYHLDHSALIEDRKKLARDLERAILNAEQFFKIFVKTKDPEVFEQFQNNIKFLQNAINIRSKYSLFAERYIAGKRNYDWIVLVFE
jgi:uncharacterized protein (TIGR02646 family)